MSSRTLAACLTVVVVGVAAAPAAAAPTTLGAADDLYPTPTALFATRAMGATVSRIVIDPAKPLAATYDAAVRLRRQAGMRVQFVVGGMSTSANQPQDLERVARATIKVFRRYPHLYSISMFNEPDLAKVRVCRYAKVFQHTYRKLQRLGAARVLVGEVMANTTTRWLKRWHRCGHHAADGFAWHGYDLIETLPGAVKQWPAVARLARRYHLTPFVTEYGVPTRGPWRVTEQEAVRRWDAAIRMAHRCRLGELVAYHVSESGSRSKWDTSLLDAHGDPRPAYMAVAGWAA